MPIQSGQSISHYRLIEKIGQGGMGVVWKAEDVILGRTVAIKVLPADSALDEQRRKMFVEEARLASSLSDAHIVQVFELGHEGDLDFIVMELVEGQPLSRQLNGRPLPPERVAHIGAQTAGALARAHRRSLLHRDIKPGNILITVEGDAKLVDFGLAGLFQDGPPGGISVTTRPLEEVTSSCSWAEWDGRRVFGTLPYMSPEQLRGERLDQRSDVFSLGTVLYEMTTGQRPFRGETVADVAAQIQKAHSQPPRELLPKVPVELDRIVQKSLAGRPAERYQTMEDLAVDLRKLGRDLDSGSAPSYGELQAAARPSSRRAAWWGVALLLAGLIAGVGWMTRDQWQGSADPHTILILPLEVRGQTEGAAYVGRAFAEAIAVDLAQTDGMKVLPVPEEREFRSTGTLDRARAAKSLGAGLLLTGAITRADGAATVDMALTDTRRNQIIWGTRAPGGGQDLSMLASSVALLLQKQLGVTPRRTYDKFDVPFGSAELLSSSELAAARAAKETERWLETANALAARFPRETYPRLLLTEFLWSRAGFKHPDAESRAAFEKSLRELNSMAPDNPWASLMDGYLLQVANHGEQAIVRFKQALGRTDLSIGLRAVFLNQMGQALSGVGRHKAAIECFELALKLTPLNIYSIDGLVWPLVKSGQVGRGVELAKQAYALEPNNGVTNYLLADALWRAHRLVEALPYQKRACELTNGLGGIEGRIHGMCMLYAQCLVEIGRIEEGLPYLIKACEQGSGSCGAYALALQKLGRVSEARLQAAKAAPYADHNALWDLAAYHALAGDRAEAVNYLKRILALGGADIWMAEEPAFKSLHGDPEFEALVAEVKRRLQQ